MSKVTTASAEAEAYLAAVRSELGHLSEAERGDLLEDLAQHLAEVAVDDADEGPVGLVARLGAPAEYAAELRAAAGLPARDDARSTSPHTKGMPATKGLLEALAGSRAIGLAQSAWRHPWAREIRAFLGQLAPAWWLLRAYLVVALVAWRTPDGVDDFPIPTVAGSRLMGVLAIVASIALGRRTLRPAGKALVLALDVAIALAGLTALTSADGRFTQVVTVAPLELANRYQLSSLNGPVTNIYPYSRAGQPLQDVLLFDQDGRPLRTALQEWWPDGCKRGIDPPRAADGVSVDFTYPVRYVLQAGVAPLGSCAAEVARPPVPLPTFPAEAPRP